MTATERFFQYVHKAPSGCWEWTGGLDPNGYGKWSWQGKTIATHRLSYWVHAGPIPEGAVLDHLCRNRKCCNPEHLQPISIAENTLRGESDAAKNKYKQTCGKGHPLVGENLYVRPDTQARMCRTCMRQATQRYHHRHPDKATARVARFRDRKRQA